MKFELTFTAPLIEWRGPAPFYFIAVPASMTQEIKDAARLLSYGWGVVPLDARIGETDFHTALIPRNGVYLLPIKNVVRLGEKIELATEYFVTLYLGS